MHELSIAMSVIELVEEESARQGGMRVRAVHVRLGALAGVVTEALRASYEIAAAGTPLADSQLVVEEVPGVVYCPACKAQRRVVSAEWFCCAECGAIASEIVQGKELEVAFLEVEP